jgi:hypothetical protein
MADKTTQQLPQIAVPTVMSSVTVSMLAALFTLDTGIERQIMENAEPGWPELPKNVVLKDAEGKRVAELAGDMIDLSWPQIHAMAPALKGAAPQAGAMTVLKIAGEDVHMYALQPNEFNLGGRKIAAKLPKGSKYVALSE